MRKHSSSNPEAWSANSLSNRCPRPARCGTRRSVTLWLALLGFALSLTAARSYAGVSVVAWGDNSYGQTNVPAGLSNVVAVSAGGYHNLALRADGTVVAWGLNNTGLTNVPVGLSNVVAVSAGYDYNLALRADGTVVAWGGYNVPLGLSNVVGVHAGGVSLALRADGRLVAWGGNYWGQTNIPAGLSNVVAMAGSGWGGACIAG